MAALIADWHLEVSPALGDLISVLAHTDSAAVKGTLQQARQLLARLPAFSTALLTDREVTTLYLVKALVNDIYFNVAMDSTLTLPEEHNSEYEALMKHVADIVRSLGLFLQHVLSGEASTSCLVDSIGAFIRLLSYMDKIAAVSERESSR